MKSIQMLSVHRRRLIIHLSIWRSSGEYIKKRTHFRMLPFVLSFDRNTLACDRDTGYPIPEGSAEGQTWKSISSSDLQSWAPKQGSTFNLHFKKKNCCFLDQKDKLKLYFVPGIFRNLFSHIFFFLISASAHSDERGITILISWRFECSSALLAVIAAVFRPTNQFRFTQPLDSLMGRLLMMPLRR